MPRIFDNIEQSLLPTLQETMAVSERADFCVGYFNLRGWRQLDSFVDQWAGGDSQCCRLLVGMQRLPQDEIRSAMSMINKGSGIDNQTALRIKKKLAEEFREQLTLGIPTNADEVGLRKLAAQIRAKKVVVKLFLGHQLHAKLYLLFRPDPINPIVGYMGSSNLTLAGLSHQGELNIDVLDHDACGKLAKWFEDRWNDTWCLDISDELAQIIESSWAREKPLLPYHIYLKMAYHLSQEARAGLSEFQIPRDFGQTLFDFQIAAVKIAAHHLNKRGGVLIGDVVGLGKTLMATALAKIFEEDHGLDALILCPKNLVLMWEDYREKYRLRGKVLSLSRVIGELPNLRRYRLVLIDESHNLRNREGKRFRAIEEYVRSNDSKCILLTATPYNKTYLDLSNQLRLFIPDEKDLGLRPETLIRELGETEFIRRHQCPVRSLSAFEKSPYADDWRDLMRLYLVRRTRSFIQDNYADTDPVSGRKYLTYEDGTKSYFPTRTPRTVKFEIDGHNHSDQYARLYENSVVDTINSMCLPRYGMGNYIASSPHTSPTPAEAKQLQDLSRAGKRLMGFCRTNLFKRLESSGASFLQSVERHVLRNYIFLHAIENDLPLPLGTQGAEFLDSRFNDEDADGVTPGLFDEDEDVEDEKTHTSPEMLVEEDFKTRASEIYTEYSGRFRKRFRWLRPALFIKSLATDLKKDADALRGVLVGIGGWNVAEDKKLSALCDLLLNKHRDQKVLVFSQFADTVRYLEKELKAHGLKAISGATGNSANPTTLAWRFSPVSNNKKNQISQDNELRVLIATDVLSEGQNLQDAAIVVNYDLPWAIIRLIQRAGRVDRIGQRAEQIICYSFLPADGVERIIRLRARVKKRLEENAEVVGADEAFFEDDIDEHTMLDLYHEKTSIMDADDDAEVDLASYAYQIWKNAVDKDETLLKSIPEMSDVCFSTRKHEPVEKKPEGVLVYVKTGEGNDALAYVDKNGKSITESQYEILKVAECKPNTEPIPRNDKHHLLVKNGVEHIIKEEKRTGGQLGRPSGARFRTYERLKRYAEDVKGTLFETPELLKVIDEVYRHPLRQTATDTINRQLKSGIEDMKLAELVLALKEENRLCSIEDEQQSQEPRIICSMGLFAG